MRKSGSNLMSLVMGHNCIIGFIQIYKCVKGLVILEINSNSSFQGIHSRKSQMKKKKSMANDMTEPGEGSRKLS